MNRKIKKLMKDPKVKPYLTPIGNRVPWGELSLREREKMKRKKEN